MRSAVHLVPTRPRRPQRQALHRVAGPGIAGVAWLLIATASAWLVFSTPLLARMANVYARNDGQTIVSTVIWAVALTAPACFAILGVTRLVVALVRFRARRPRPSLLAAQRIALPPDCVLVQSLWLPDGRRIPDVVVGPHGIAFFEPLPPAAAVRRTGARWEARFADGTWRPIDDPLQRAARDADALRRFLVEDDREFLVKVTAAVTGSDPYVERGDGCSVVALADVAGWLAALPTQRGLTPDRLAHVRRLLATLA